MMLKFFLSAGFLFFSCISYSFRNVFTRNSQIIEKIKKIEAIPTTIPVKKFFSNLNPFNNKEIFPSYEDDVLPAEVDVGMPRVLTIVSKSISQELNPTIIRSKLSSGIAESFFNEIFYGASGGLSTLLASTSLTDPNFIAVRGVLVDLSMSVCASLQNYLRYKDRGNWKCDGDSCELMDVSSSLDSINLEGALTSLHNDGDFADHICEALAMERIISGTVISFLIPLDDTSSSAAASPFLPSISDQQPSFIMEDTQLTTAKLQQQPSAETGRSGVSSRPPALAAHDAAVAQISSPHQSLSAIGRYCMVSLLVNLFSHQLMPMMLHYIENSVQHVFPV